MVKKLNLVKKFKLYKYRKFLERLKLIIKSYHYFLRILK